MPTYQPLIPTGSVNLDIDYQNIQGNFQQLNTVYGTDHLPFDNAGAQQGYHTVIHMSSSANPPATVPTTGQLYSASVTNSIGTDTNLFYLSGTGKKFQLTGNFLPVGNTNGYTALPGGLIMQWGVFATATGPSGGMTATQTVPILFATANIAFPTNCFNVQVTLISQTAVGTSSSNNSLFILLNSVSKTGFSARFNGNNHDFNGFYWTAIGN